MMKIQWKQAVSKFSLHIALRTKKCDKQNYDFRAAAKMLCICGQLLKCTRRQSKILKFSLFISICTC